jgi:polysaccharide biosynthesis transport protein
MRPAGDGLSAGHGFAPYEIRDEEGLDPLKLFWRLVHYRWIVAGCFVAALVAGFGYTYTQTPLYRATAKLEIFAPSAKVFRELEVVSQAPDWRIYETARLKLQSRELARRVVYELNLAENDDFLVPQASFSLWNFVYKALGREAGTGLDDRSPEQREALATGAVLDGLSAAPITSTSVLSISYRHPDPRYAAEIANQAVRSFIDQSVDKNSETSDLARQFIEEQVRETKAKLQSSEQALVAYAKRQNITLTGDDASLIAGNISELNSALAQAIQDRLSAERYLDQVEAGNAAILPEVFASESIRATREKIAELKASYEEKRGSLKPGFPEMRRIQAQIDELQRQVDLEIAAIAGTVRIRFEQARDTENGIKRELEDLERQQRTFQDKNIQYTILKREVESNRTQYESLIAKRNEVGVGSELRNANASVVDLAPVPQAPYTPRLSRNLLSALALFGMFGAALIYLLELMNNTFAVPDQIESELNLPVLGIIPVVSADQVSQAFVDPRSQISEAYRSLRTSLQFTGTEHNIKTLLVTSSEPAEGKTATVHKLAAEFAALGRRVLVIDADLRKPKLHRHYNVSNSLGLSNLLSNVVRQGDVLQLFHRTGCDNITFLSSGTVPPNPVDLLASQKMSAVLHYCSKVYDLILIDSPPILGLADAPILSRQSDATLLIVAARQAPRKAAKAAIARLRAAGGNVVGAALTKFSIDRLDYNYSYRYMRYDYYDYAGDNRQLTHDGAGGAVAAGRLAPRNVLMRMQQILSRRDS